MLHTLSPLEVSTTDIASQPAWVEGLRRNEPAVVRAFYRAHLPAVRSYVIQNSGTSTDAQDVFQEAMSVLWLQAKEGRLAPGSDPGAFLFRVAKNKWLDVVRSAAHRHMKVVHDERTEQVPAASTDEVEERLARLRGVYDKLDDKCRQVLDRFYFERKDLATIAGEMGVEVDSIRTIKYRCMMKLRAFRRTILGDETVNEP